MASFRFFRFLLVVCMISTFATGLLLAQAAFPGSSMKASVGGNNFSQTKSTGSLALSSSGVSFDSPDFVFHVPVDDILAVEYHGARDGFLTLVLDGPSKFLAAYPSLVSQRMNSIHEQERLLVISLDPSGSIDAEAGRAKAFQAFVQEHRVERERATVGAAQIDSANSAAHPSFGKTLHVVIRGSMSSEMHDGLLSFFPDRLQFDGQDATIRFPLDQIVGLDPAGARETFLLVHVDRRSKMIMAYRDYQKGYGGGDFQFILAPQEAIAPAFRLAEDFEQYADAVRSGREQATVSGGGAADSSGGTASIGSASLASSASSSGEKRELARYDAGFLERHSPASKMLNGFKVINRIPGTLVVFDTGLGYVSMAQNPSLKPTRQQFTQSGYLKFFLPQAAVLGVHDVSVIRNQNLAASNSYIAEVDLDRNSGFYQQNKALMAESDQDNRLFFTFKDRGSLNQFLSHAPHGSGVRDSF